MLYPTILFKTKHAPELYIPDPELVRKTYEHLLSTDSTTPFPFWAKIWPSAFAMIHFLREEPQWIKGKKLLEIGAGIGLPSFTVANQVKEIIISDHATEAVALMEKNIAHMQLANAKAMCFDWNDSPDGIQTEVVLLSDINYAPEQFPSLLKLIHLFLEQGTIIILTTPQRITITPFAEALMDFVKHSSLQVIDEVEIRVWVLKK